MRIKNDLRLARIVTSKTSSDGSECLRTQKKHHSTKNSARFYQNIETKKKAFANSCKNFIAKGKKQQG